MAFRETTFLNESDITNQMSFAVPLSGFSQGPMSLREMHKTISITYLQSSRPGANSPTGFYSTQTGADRGLYLSSGVGEPLILAAYDVDGVWPVP